MPLFTAPVTTPPDTGEPGGGGVIVLPDLGRATVTYYDPAGVAWPLTRRSLGWYTLAEGVSGLGAAPYELTTDAHPRGGARLRHVQAQPRTIVWPLWVGGADHMEFVQRWRQLATAFTRTLRDGPGVLEIARPDGTRRRINVIYQEGWEGRGTRGFGRIFDSAVLSLWCEDPYWVDPVPVMVHREQGVGVDFLEPYPSVSSSQVLGATTVTNPGDVVVWPTWTITGPASLVTFTHTGAGKSFELDPSAVGHGNLLAGEQVTVRTDPVQVRFENGDNWVGALNWPDAVLWGLAPGDNAVTFTLSGSGPGSAVDLAFNSRYETA
ncbi:phage tail family protein [Streptomyces sp. DSM 3412]|uniref:Phage tail family protein n=1 Tax=Streptomyces gottesmaniae TaxID=3075518 RepID=A0ABU2YUC1_9ACTN|nr:phage tail family protein [Streptomyces sp. DSM 3412]MDT0567924.1 phage tail family protein [Streptomyces sp. DSM 3412]